MGYLEGFAVTFKKLFKGTRTGQTVTVPYVKDSGPKREKPVRHHGRHVLNRYPDGMEKCIGCELCAGACPARCIYVRGADNPVDAPVSPGERYGFVYEINMLRCIFCGLCVEACPTEAITMTQLFEFSTTNRADSVYTKDELLMRPDGSVPHMFPADPFANHEGLLTADGWVRATAPSGDATYEGRVGWSGELGFGVKPPEQGQTAAEAVPEPKHAPPHHPHDDDAGEVPDDDEGPVASGGNSHDEEGHESSAAEEGMSASGGKPGPTSPGGPGAGSPDAAGEGTGGTEPHASDGGQH